MRAENFSQIFNLGVHAVEHLADGVDFDFAAFEAFEGKFDSEMFGEFYEYRLVGLAFRGLRGKPGDGPLQSVLRASRQFRHLLLELAGSRGATLAATDISKAGQGT
jgi:hypothetical protein